MSEGNRKLDVLFAEKVLGLQPYQFSPRMDYTVSLDAAWAGVERSRRHELFSFSFSLGLSDDWAGYRARFVFPRDGQTYEATATEPSLAVVKACLLAAGVGPAEIDEAAELKP